MSNTDFKEDVEMKKRIAYLGLSYPLFYDYQNQAPFSENDTWDSPNPIIESPLGLMILYDELWFLCESLCPSNMRGLSYVKYVDKIYPDLYYKGAELFRKDVELKLDYKGLDYQDMLDRMNLTKSFGSLDNHSHGIKIGDIIRSGNADEENLKFDIYVFMALQERSVNSIELVSNSRFCMNEFLSSPSDAEVIEKIIIPDVPNYLNKEGPYHPCIEELRENKYLIDFRKWIINTHNTIQKSEINEICADVDRTIKYTQEKVFNKYLNDNSKYKFFKSSSKTVVKTVAGIISIPFSIAEAIAEITINGKNTLEVNGDRWQGFVIQSRNIINLNKL